LVLADTFLCFKRDYLVIDCMLSIICIDAVVGFVDCMVLTLSFVNLPGFDGYWEH